MKNIWDTYHNDIEKYVFSIVKDRDLMQDIVQDTFIKANSKIHTLKDQSKLKKWLLSIARNTSIDAIKKAGKEVELVSDLIEDDSFEDGHTAEDCLVNIIKNLPEKYKTPLLLSDIKGLKHAQISEQLKLPLPTVKSQIQRARKLIKKGLMDCCDYTENENGYLVGETKEKEDCKVCK